MRSPQTNLISRPPVVVILGHIDHGKSTLLDFIRQSNLTANEAGGITQAVGAYEVKHKTKAGEERRLTFIDTPGHEAFSACRSSGASIADVAILVVSAEEGPKPQTLECYRLLNQVKLPLVVAINKIDKPAANLDRVKQQLGEAQIALEGYGGQIPWAAVSAKTGEGMEELLELVALAADLIGLSADPARPARGFVLESRLDPRQGASATLVIKDGTLHQSDWLLINNEVSKIRRLADFRGRPETALGFSSPAVVTGFAAPPPGGAEFRAFASRELAAAVKETVNSDGDSHRTVSTLAPENVADDHERLEIPVVIKTDVSGSIDAVRRELQKIVADRVKINILSAGTGPINENDVNRAAGTTAPIILGFNVKIERGGRDAAERLGAVINSFTVIYELAEWLKEEIKRRLPQEKRVVARAKILKWFSGDKKKQIVGGEVAEGTLGGGKTFRIVRREAALGDGRLLSLQRGKEPVASAAAGEQFGALVESTVKIASGDVLEILE